jgi:hypothetical protein
MLEKLQRGQGQRSAANDLARRSVNSIGLAVAVGVAYFLAARLSVGLLSEEAWLCSGPQLVFRQVS